MTEITGYSVTDMPTDVADKFESYPKQIREKLLVLRSLILEVASQMPEVGEMEETLKWREPAYLTSSNSGSMIRVGWRKSAPDEYCMYFLCHTSLVNMFKKKYGGLFSYKGTRAIVFSLEEDIPIQELSDCIRQALVYKLLG